MNSSENTMRTLVLIPIASAMVGILVMLGITLLGNPASNTAPSMEQPTVSTNEMARSGDGVRSFHVARPEGDYQSFTL